MKWTKEEEEQLRDEYVNKRLSLATIASLHDRSIIAIESKIRRLGLTRDRPKYVTWTPEDERIILQNYKKYKSIRELHKKHFPDKTYAAVKAKVYHMNLNPSMREDLPSTVLRLLQMTPYPYKEEDLEHELSTVLDRKILHGEVDTAVDYLYKQGYDIKKIVHGDTVLYSLIRTADISQEQYYKILGQVKLPILITGDWHLGSKQYSDLAYNQLLNDIKDFKPKSILMPGDLLQGRGVHRVEMQDLVMPNITDQIVGVISRLKKIPSSIDIHIVIGNHEEKVKGSVEIGLDPLRLIANNLDNAYYYGHVTKLEIENTDGMTINMMHGSGGVTRSISYRGDVIWDGLIEKPNILLLGHLHKLGKWAKPPYGHIIYGGTLQRENAWLLMKGWVAEVGWCIIRDLDRHKMDYIERRPKVY